jgi:hypothetical protein
MEMEPPLRTTSEQLPQIRRVATLDRPSRVVEAGKVQSVPATKKPISSAKPEISEGVTTPKQGVPYVTIVVGILLVVALFFEILLNQRYMSLNKKTTDAYIAQQNKYEQLQELYKDLKSFSEKTTAEKEQLDLENKKIIVMYEDLGSKFKQAELDIDQLRTENTQFESQSRILQFRLNRYSEGHKKISLSKAVKIRLLKGNSAVALAKVEAVNVQNEMLKGQLEEKESRLRDLTIQLMQKIKEQELLLKENIGLKAMFEKSPRKKNAAKSVISVPVGQKQPEASDVGK